MSRQSAEGEPMPTNGLSATNGAAVLVAQFALFWTDD